MQERRRHPRLSQKIPLAVKVPAFDLTTESLNISCSGVYCQINQYIAPMTKIKMVILLPKKSKNRGTSPRKINCQGIVVRTEKSQNSKDKFNIAVFFNEILKSDVEYIADYIKNRLPADSPGSALGIINGLGSSCQSGCVTRYPRGAS